MLGSIFSYSRAGGRWRPQSRVVTDGFYSVFFCNIWLCDTIYEQDIYARPHEPIKACTFPHDLCLLRGDLESKGAKDAQMQDSRYCSAICQRDHRARGGHDSLCKIECGAEEYHADTIYARARAAAVKACAEGTKGHVCPSQGGRPP